MTSFTSFVVTLYYVLQNEHLMCRNTRPSVAVRLSETNAEGMGDGLVSPKIPFMVCNLLNLSLII